MSKKEIHHVQQNKLVIDFLLNLPIGEYFEAVASGTSMYPTILPGQKLTINNVPTNKLYVGDIVAFAIGRKQKIIVHRIIRKFVKNKMVYVQTKGDNNKDGDHFTLPGSSIMGKVEIK